MDNVYLNKTNYFLWISHYNKNGIAVQDVYPRSAAASPSDGDGVHWHRGVSTSLVSKTACNPKQFAPGGNASRTPALDPPLTTFYEKLLALYIGVSKGGARDAYPPGGPNSFIFM